MFLHGGKIRYGLDIGYGVIPYLILARNDVSALYYSGAYFWDEDRCESGLGTKFGLV